MVYELETTAVTKKQVEEIEVAEIKMLRFAIEWQEMTRLKMSTSGVQLR